jgi:hypothetical protein
VVRGGGFLSLAIITAQGSVETALFSTGKDLGKAHRYHRVWSIQLSGVCSAGVEFVVIMLLGSPLVHAGNL